GRTRSWDLALDRADPLVTLLAERFAGTGEHLAERLAAADAEELDLGVAAWARQPPDPLRELSDGQHDRIVGAAERHAVAGEQGGLRDQAGRVRHRDPVAHHARVRDRQRNSGAGLAEEDLGRGAGRP